MCHPQKLHSVADNDEIERRMSSNSNPTMISYPMVIFVGFGSWKGPSLRFAHGALLLSTPFVSKQKLRLDIICGTKQNVRLVKFLSNFIKRIGMLLETM